MRIAVIFYENRDFEELLAIERKYILVRKLIMLFHELYTNK